MSVTRVKLTPSQFLAEVQKLQAEKHIDFAQAVTQLTSSNKHLVASRDCMLLRTCYSRQNCGLLRLLKWMSDNCLDDFKLASLATQIATVKCKK